MHTSKITDKVLLGISEHVASKFIDLGIGLGLDYSAIINCVSRVERQPDYMKAFEVLQEWKAEKGIDCEALAKALKGIRMGGIALKYCYLKSS